MTTAERQRENRQYYLSRGLCPNCGGKAYVQPGRVLCIECQQKQDDRLAERRKRWKDEGRCTRCGGERDVGKKMCARCREYMAGRKYDKDACKKRREKLKMMGLCISCGKRWAEPGRVRCKDCMARQREAYKRYDPDGSKSAARRAARMAEGICTDCGKPAKAGNVRCAACLEARRDSARKYYIIKKIEREAERAKGK